MVNIRGLVLTGKESLSSTLDQTSKQPVSFRHDYLSRWFRLDVCLLEVDWMDLSDQSDVVELLEPPRILEINICIDETNT